MNNWWVSVVVILALIAVGVLLIHLVNAHHRQDMASYPYSRSLWAPGRRSRRADDVRTDDRRTDDGRADDDNGNEWDEERRDSD
ncbi:hypothetical protein [Streptomyces sp. NBC_01429]|uniref:hypothetical protein n=1 Tax=Streptomyces sp. NBC_01429 TaxID=2903862 RepID=UPI002E2BDECB|nr:hypothetical protein [Streptomyces sp. NBC_01429]